MKEILGRYFIINNYLRASSRFNPLFLSKGKNIYEVVRVIRGKILFLEDHFERVMKSGELSKLKIWYDLNMLRGNLKDLINANKLQLGNIKFIFHFESDKKNNYFFAYPVPYNYPKQDEYNFGVKLLTHQFHRPQPNVKKWLPDFKSNIAELKEKNEVYEILLVNDEGIITEGSQSNFFMVRGNSLVTAPKNMVLPGITRKYVFRICKEQNIEIKEQAFKIADVLNCESAFISGTSPKILPVSEIDGKRLLVKNFILQKLMTEYDKLVEDYISRSIFYDL